MAKKASAKQSSRRRYSTRRSPDAQKSRRTRIRRILFSILVVLIVALTIFFLVFKGGGQISIFENAAGSLLTPVQNAFSTATGAVKTFFTNWHNYGALQEEYDQLAMTNEQLKMELVSAEEAIKENERLQALLDARPTYSSLDPIYAKVIARDAGTCHFRQ